MRRNKIEPNSKAGAGLCQPDLYHPISESECWVLDSAEVQRTNMGRAWVGVERGTDSGFEALRADQQQSGEIYCARSSSHNTRGGGVVNSTSAYRVAVCFRARSC